LDVALPLTTFPSAGRVVWLSQWQKGMEGKTDEETKRDLLTLLAQQSGQINLLIVAPISDALFSESCRSYGEFSR